MQSIAADAAAATETEIAADTAGIIRGNKAREFNYAEGIHSAASVSFEEMGAVPVFDSFFILLR